MHQRPPETAERIMAALGYVGVLVVLPLALARGIPFVRHHARQGLLLLAVEVLLGWVPGWGWYMVGPFTALLAIAGIAHALSGREWKIPGVGELAEMIPL